MKQLSALLTALAGLVTTVNGYRPFPTRWLPVRAGFVAGVCACLVGVVASELPLQTIVTQGAALAVVSRKYPRLRRSAWLVCGLSWLGLLGLHRIARDANVPLTTALDAGLGVGRRTDSDGIWRRPPPGAATAKKPGALRMARIYRDYTHDADISYGEWGKHNLLDIWRRPDLDRGGAAPVLLQVPGGAWTSGNKRGQAHPLMSHLVELGWVCVSINYRLSPGADWPDHIVDVKRAIAWVKAHIAEYGGDPDFIAVTGGSAGGHLSSLAALTPNDPLFQPGFEDADTQVQAAVPFYGVYDFTRTDVALHPVMVWFLEERVLKGPRAEIPDLFRSSSSITYVNAAAPPFFVLHGHNDSLIPVEQARTFADRLRDVSRQPVVYAELPRTQHAFDTFGSLRAAHCAVAVEQFLAEVYVSRHSSDT
jgi:acetyl esterase/lipase